MVVDRRVTLPVIYILLSYRFNVLSFCASTDNPVNTKWMYPKICEVLAILFNWHCYVVFLKTRAVLVQFYKVKLCWIIESMLLVLLLYSHHLCNEIEMGHLSVNYFKDESLNVIYQLSAVQVLLKCVAGLKVFIKVKHNKFNTIELINHLTTELMSILTMHSTFKNPKCFTNICNPHSLKDFFNDHNRTYLPCD